MECRTEENHHHSWASGGDTRGTKTGENGWSVLVCISVLYIPSKSVPITDIICNLSFSVGVADPCHIFTLFSYSAISNEIIDKRTHVSGLGVESVRSK